MAEQAYLFETNGSPSQFVFRGADLEAQDLPRLTRHLERFIAYVSDGAEHTLTQVASVLGMSACSASARYRDIKRLGYSYTKRRDEKVAGLWHYRVTGRPE